VFLFLNIAEIKIAVTSAISDVNTALCLSIKIAADKEKEKGTCKRGCTSAMTVRGDYEHCVSGALSPRKDGEIHLRELQSCFLREAFVGARFIFVYF
jgi:hypothetical protein